MKQKTEVRRLECTLCDWHTWGFKRNISHEDFQTLLEKAHQHIREMHDKRSSGKYLDMPFMPNDYPLEETEVCPCCGQSIIKHIERQEP